MSEKTHYRKVFKSDHLGQADLEDFIEAGKRLVFTIKQVKQEFGTKVAGKKIDANIAYFVEDIKPWVVNAGNSAILKKLSGGSPFVEDWSDLTVELYIDHNVKYKGETTGGVKVSPKKPKIGKPELKPGDTRWQSAIDIYKDTGSLDRVLARATITEDNQKLIREAANVE